MHHEALKKPRLRTDRMAKKFCERSLKQDDRDRAQIRNSIDFVFSDACAERLQLLFSFFLQTCHACTHTKTQGGGSEFIGT
jgi:hypothetical protein